MRRSKPSGCTPLTEHIMEIYTEIFEMVPELRRTGQKVAIILATVSWFVSIKLQGQLTDCTCPTTFTHVYSSVCSSSIQDGLPTDERGYGGAAHQNAFVDKLRLLEGLPVWVVIRLCTVRIATAPAICIVKRVLLIHMFSLVSLVRRTTMRL
jgi:hypothetical protein